MGIEIIILIAVVLVGIAVKVRRGSFFWWSGKDGRNR